MYTTMHYGHWGITVSQRLAPSDYAPVATEFFSYPVGLRGPSDSADTEQRAMARCRELGGTPKGPFFSRTA